LALWFENAANPLHERSRCDDVHHWLVSFLSWPRRGERA
jgi:hypothetical protein